jgi:hypothetical protein
VVPVVVFLRAGNFPRQLSLGDDQHAYLSFDFLYCELARLRAEDYLDSANLVARLNLPNMRHPRKRRVEIYASALRGLLTLESNSHKQRKYLDFIDGYANLSEAELELYHAEYVEKTEDTNMGLAAFLLEKGRAEGESRIITKLLTLRFGKLPEWVEARLAEAKPEQLEAWSQRILTANTLEDVFSA